MKWEKGPLVSTQILGERVPSIVDGSQTMGGTKMIEVASWYDNVAGYTAQAAKLVKMVGSS